MQVRVLGALEVTAADSTPCVVPGARRRLLLATLVLHRNEACSTDRLVDVLFGVDPPVRAAGTVQSYVSRLRHDLGVEGHRLQTQPGGYQLVVGADELDSVRFERQVAGSLEVLGRDPHRAADLLGEALGWWSGGRAYAEFVDDLALQAESTRLEEVRQRAAEAHVDALLALADHAGAIDQLETCIASWPLREGFRAQHMLALYRSGRQPEALQAFQRFRSELGSQLGLEPSGPLTDLEARMVRTDPSLVPTPALAPIGPATPAPAAGVVVGNLPRRVTALLGRDGELSQLTALLPTVPLLTVTGPGGVGKTRVAMQLCERLAVEHPDGAWLCDLAPVREDALVAEAVTTALDVQRRQDRSTIEGLVEVLQSRSLLIVLDNCEHVLAPIREVIEALLQACPDVRIVATSREPLGVDGETVWTLGPLRLPSADEADPVMAMESPAVRLFVARATAAHPGVRLDEGTVSSVVAICRRLDGLPLALELAAARVRSMTLPELAEELSSDFTILATSARQPRHRTLEATVAWSYELLGAAEQALFDRLSVFAGGFTMDDIVGVCADAAVSSAGIRGLLAALVDKSMVVADVSRSPTRYSLLETLRQFGAARLRAAGQAETLHERHARWTIEVVEQAEVGLSGPDEPVWMSRLEDTFADLRIAHRWALSRADADAALRLVVGAREFAFRRMHYELFSWAEATLELADTEDHPLLPMALATAAYGRFVRGELDAAMTLAARSLDAELRLCVPPCGLNLRTQANVHYYRRRTFDAAETCERMVESARTSGDDVRLTHALYMASVGLASDGRTEASRLLAEEAISVARRIDNPTSLASALYARALVLETIDPHRAVSTLEESIAHGTAAGNRWIVAFAETELVSLAGRRGALDGALRLARDVIDMWHRAGDWANQWLTLRHVAGVLAQRGDHEAAAMLHAAVRVASAELAMPIEASDLRRVGAILEQLPSALGQARHAEAEARGAAMGADTVVQSTREVIDRLLTGASSDRV